MMRVLNPFNYTNEQLTASHNAITARMSAPNPNSRLLRERHPDKFCQLLPELNPGINLDAITYGSSKRLMWFCLNTQCEHLHIWEATPHSRTNSNSGCPFVPCSKKPSKFCECFSAEQNPFLVDLNSFTNEQLLVLYNTNKATLPPQDLNSRLLKYRFPDLFAQLLQVLNKGVNLNLVTWSVNKHLIWYCLKSPCNHPHIWIAEVSQRTSGNTGCPFSYCNAHPHKYCPCDLERKNNPIPINLDNLSNDQLLVIYNANKAILSAQDASSNLLKYCRPDLFARLFPQLNKNINLDKITVGSNIEVIWYCDKSPCKHNHLWVAPVWQICHGSGCPFAPCAKSARQVCECYSLKGQYPNMIEKEYDYERNKQLKLRDPEYVAVSCSEIRHWKHIGPCRCEHSWAAVIGNRTREVDPTGCPFYPCCPASRQFCIHYSLAGYSPILLKEYNYEANKELGLSEPENVSFGSGEYRVWKCSECNFNWRAIIFARTRKDRPTGCPKCRSSKLEKNTSNVLNNLNLSYDPQMKFEECKDKTYLRYDFYIPSLKLLIDLDGRQHFEVINFFDGYSEEGLADRKKKDQIKNEFAKKNGLHLLRISYSEADRLEEHIVQMIKDIQTSPQSIYRFIGEEYEPEEYEPEEYVILPVRSAQLTIVERSSSELTNQFSNMIIKYAPIVRPGLPAPIVRPGLPAPIVRPGLPAPILNQQVTVPISSIRPNMPPVRPVINQSVVTPPIVINQTVTPASVNHPTYTQPIISTITLIPSTLNRSVATTPSDINQQVVYVPIIKPTLPTSLTQPTLNQAVAANSPNEVNSSTDVHDQ